jgi:hypothetical protein
MLLHDLTTPSPRSGEPSAAQRLRGWEAGGGTGARWLGGASGGGLGGPGGAGAGLERGVAAGHQSGIEGDARIA